MVLSYQSPHLAKATEVVAVERTGGLHHYTVSAGAENYHPNQVSNLASSLEIARADGGAIVLVSTIPNGFDIVDNDVFEGKKIIATKPFKKGEQLYVGHCAVLDLSGIGHGFKLKIYSEDRQLLSQHFNDDTHSVDDHAPGSKTGSESKRQVYGWDGFMNHSCDANSYHPCIYRTPTEMCYRAIAVRDIMVGDEVTCDYALFDYQCNGHEIEVCACGSPKCRGKMLGFQALSLDTKVDILHMVEDEILEKFVKDENVMIFQTHLPPGIDLVRSEDGDHLVATRRFGVGETLFNNRAELISKDDLVDKKFVIKVDGTYILLDSQNHFVHRDGYAEMLGFDTFMDHSCSPCTEQEYVNKNEYVVRAKKNIMPGDKITCDYMVALDNSAVGMLNIATTSFVCECGEINCKGMIVA